MLLRFLLRWDKIAGVSWKCFPSSMWRLSGVELWFSLPAGELGFSKSPWVRLWLNSFSWGQPSLRRLKWSGILQNGSCYSRRSRRLRALLSSICGENLLELLQVKLTNVWGLHCWIPLKVFSIRLVQNGIHPSANYSSGFPASALIVRRFVTVGYYRACCDSLHSLVSLSNFGGTSCTVTSFFCQI